MKIFGTKFQDWFASRTVRFATYLTGLYSVMLAATIGLSAYDWQVLGVSESLANRIVLVIAIIGNIRAMRLRQITEKPLDGLAEAKAKETA